MPSEPPDNSSDRPRPWSPPIRRVSGAPSVSPLPPAASSEEEPFELRGPGAPARSPGAGDMHPVRARLLERAQASAAASNTPSPPATETAPSRLPSAKSLSLVSHHLGDDSSATLLGERAEGSEGMSRPSPNESALGPAAPGAPSPEEAPDEARTAPPPEVTLELERIARDPARGPKTPPPSPFSARAQALLLTLLGVSIAFTAAIFVDRLYSKSDAPPDGAELAVPAVQEPPKDLPGPVRKKVEGPSRLAQLVDPSQRLIQGKFGREPFLRAIEKAGVPRAEAYRAFAALRHVRNLDRCGPNDTFQALLRRSDKRLTAFEYIVSPEEVYQAKTDPAGRLTATKLDLKVERNQVRRSLVIQGSFEDSARRNGFDTGLGGVVEKALSGHLALSELKRGDKIRVVVQEVTVLGEFARYAGVEAIELLRSGGHSERFYYYAHPLEGGYFDASGRAPWEGGFRKPVPGAPITSKFNLKRLNPVLKKVMPHTGTDFGAPTGTPILATKSGKITFSGWGGANGNFVRIVHDGGYESGYSHLSRFVDGLKVGDTVERLQPIGYIGSTGRSTGPHLHFHIKKNGEYVDPESLNLDGKRILPQSHRDAFAEVRAKYDPILEAIAWPAPLAPEAELVAETMPPLGTDEEEGDPSSAEPPAPPTVAALEPAPERARTPAPAPAQAPVPAQARPAQPGVPAVPAVGAARRAIFLTDSELQRAQPRTSDGEVEE